MKMKKAVRACWKWGMMWGLLGILCRPLCVSAESPVSAVPADPAPIAGENGTAAMPVSPNSETRAMTDIHDIKPLAPVRLPSTIPRAAWYALAGLLLAGVLAAVWLRRRRPPRLSSEGAPEPARPPDEAAYEALDALAAESGLPDKMFYFRLSALLRTYLSGRFGVEALEMTTEELLPAVERMAMEKMLKSGINSFLRFSDPVKFADMSASPSQKGADIEFVRLLVKETSRAAASVGEKDAAVAHQAK